MKIAVCLPSLNEADNIQNITKIVDKGLTDFIFKNDNLEAVIVNVDSNSDDNTVKLFKETETKNKKHSITLKEARGKGKNILEFCKYVSSNDIDYCLTIDSDITSATPEWVEKLLNPLIKENAIYVTPVYERSRFEGSSTNHFAFPLVYSLSGKVVRQPIAGDFAFSKELANEISNNKLVETESIQKYGIDIFMTLIAVSMNKPVLNVNLNKKKHAPSFSKLEFMFPQIATAALLSSSKVIDGELEDIQKEDNNILPSIAFPHKEAAKGMRERAKEELKKLKNQEWIDQELATNFIKSTDLKQLKENEMVSLWTTILTKWFEYYKNKNLTPQEAGNAGKELLPFFVLRATGFWFWSENVEDKEVEEEVRYQAKLLRNKIQKI